MVVRHHTHTKVLHHSTHCCILSQLILWPVASQTTTVLHVWKCIASYVHEDICLQCKKPRITWKTTYNIDIGVIGAIYIQSDPIDNSTHRSDITFQLLCGWQSCFLGDFIDLKECQHISQIWLHGGVWFHRPQRNAHLAGNGQDELIKAWCNSWTVSYSWFTKRESSSRLSVAYCFSSQASRK